jgi:phenylalanyl-tRNA synthetase beta chain
LKLSREWLNDYTQINVSDKEYAERMTMTGSKVEGVEVTRSEIKGVVAGRVTSIVRHEDSNHLWICKVDAGREKEFTIVTGAQNVKAGDMVPVALDGATLPGGITITTGEIRGALSQGMLCSLKELGLDTHDYPYAIEDGIFIMQEPCKPGDDIIKVLGLGDSVVDFEITNNRPDCFSIIGLARESAATFGTELKIPAPAETGSGDNVEDYLKIEIKDPDLCPRYTARMVKNIKIQPSPAWMRRRLRACGIRPINNIVDITNYVMLEYGQPMHAFDYSCVGGGKIVVRRAKEGETIETLDGKLRKLTTDMLVIADETKPVGIAGVMGGQNSEVTEKTSAIVFESANFDGTSIRKTSIALGMRTDASGLFEKGLDPSNTVPAVQRACELVELLGAGEVMEGMIDVVAVEPKSVRLPLEPDRINRLLGTSISREFMVGVLTKLGFQMDGDMIIIPSWRSDIEHYADIAEEIARFYGYDVIEPTMFKGVTAQGGYSDRQNAERLLGQLCRSMGFNEIMTYSFGSASDWDKIHLPEDSPLRKALVIQNPLGEDTSVMRTTSLPSMLNVLAVNINKRNRDVRLYEMATVYLPKEGSPLANEKTILTMGAYGKGADFYGIKDCVEAILKSMRIVDVSFTALRDNPAYHPGRCAEIRSGNVVLGCMGQIHPLVCEEFEIDREVCAVELDVEKLLSCRGPEPTYVPLPRFPAVTRDIAIVCDAEIPVADLKACIIKAGGKYLESCDFFDVYVGANIPEGKKSVAFALTMRAEDQTLTDEHAEETVNDIIGALNKEYGAVIR